MVENGFSKQFEEIQRDRQGVVHSSVYPGIKELVSNIYPEEAHFIYELLQNAEDAKASEVHFEIKKDMLVFRHNGTKLFDADDVDSITNIAKSTKKENYVQAGKFGIGFKSVYAFTDTPSIYCDSVCFKIVQLLLPEQIDDLRERDKGWTEFHFPFDSPKITAENAKKKIQKGLTEIESTTLLFLNNINKLDYVLEDGSTFSVTKRTQGRLVFCSVISGGKTIQNDTWMRFTKDSELYGKGIQVDVAFPMEYSEKGKAYDFARGDDKVCIKFLAKNEKSNLRFFINAPFGCTPSRDTVNKDDEANKELIKEIASLIKTCISELREKNYLTDQFFEILPLEDDDIPEFYQPIVDAIKRSFSDEKNLPTMVKGEYVTVENGIMSRRDVIDKLFTQNDIRELFQNDNLCFVKNRPLNTRAYKFLKSLEIKDLSPEAVLIQMANIGENSLLDWIKPLKNEKLEDLYSYLCKGIDNLTNQAEKLEDYKSYAISSWYRFRDEYEEERKQGEKYLELKEQLDDIKEIAIVKITDREFVKASDAYIVEEKIDVPAEYHVVPKILYKKEQAKRFLKSMGVNSFTQEELQEYQYNNETSDMEKFLDGLSSTEVQKQTRPLGVVRKILEFLDEHEFDEISWDDYKVVYAKHKDRHMPSWYTPSECCLDKPLIDETGLNNATEVHKKCVVDEIYNELSEKEKDKWVEFLKQCGVLWTIKVKFVSRSTGYVTGYDTDYEIPYLRSYLQLHSIPLARYIWKSLSSGNGWDSSYRTKYHKLNKNYSGRTEESSVLSILKNTKWVPDIDGEFRLPKDVSRETIDKSFIIDEANGFLAAIGFGEKAKKREEEEKARREREYLEQAQQIEAAKRLGFESTDDVLATKEDSRKVAELKALGLDIDEIISSEKKKRKERERKSIDAMMASRKDEDFREGSSSDYDVAAVVSNPDRRREKLEEELSEEPEETKRKVTVSKVNKPNKEERQFLHNQYGGKCQICEKKIVKKDGSHHFEAINLMDTSILEEKYLTGLSIGWNSLCMCPNCAAEFKYGAISLYDFQEKVLDLTIDRSVDDYLEFPIRMQGEERVLRYSPVHLFSLQTALNHFKNVHSGNIKTNDSESNTSFVQQQVATEIKVLESGDMCPDCGEHNISSTRVNVLDKNGESCELDVRLCQCGTKYLTRSMYKKLDNPEKYNLVKAVSSAYTAAQNKKKAEKQQSIVIKKKNTHIVLNAGRSDTEFYGLCRKCGKRDTFAGTGYCYSCYKEERQALYDM